MNDFYFLSKEDFYQVSLGSMLASYDRDILTTLYQPIVGYQGLALYFTLWSEVKRCEYNELNRHEILIKEMGMTIDDIYNARLKLEGIGLLKTYFKREGESQAIYHYQLFAPKSPEDFFNDVIFKGLLSRKIGEKEVLKLTLFFSSKNLNYDEYQEISAKFSNVFNVDDSETNKVWKYKSNRGRKTLDIRGDFQVGEFLNEISKVSKINKSSFEADDLNEISRIATLFGFNVSEMVDIVSRVFDPYNKKHLDYKDLYQLANKYQEGSFVVNVQDNSNSIKEYSNEDELAKKINLMNQVSPFEYLKFKQGYSNPSPADVNILNILSSRYQLTNPVINALIDFTLLMCDNDLPKAYIEKIAATLKRKNVTTAIAAMNALKSKRRRNKSEVEFQEEIKTINQNDNIDSTRNKNEDNLSIEDMLKDIEGL